MDQPLRCVSPDSLIVGWDFSTSAVKCLAFDLGGNAVASVRLPTDLWTEGGVSELNLMQLEGQARASVRELADRLRQAGRIGDWVAGGISATHHTAGRIDARHNQVRRAICWNDETLAAYHAKGVARLGGLAEMQRLIGGPWAVRYSLSHLVKDESTLKPDDWKRTARILPHGPLAAGYLTGNFDVTSVSSAASTGIMDLRTNRWCREMLGCLEKPEYRELAWAALPRIIDGNEPVGPLAGNLASEAGIDPDRRPLIFPTSDDQAAGLVGGGAVSDGQVAIILGTSAVVNSSSDRQPSGGTLDVMKLNWGPYLWMRCYSNGAQSLNKIVGADPDWQGLGAAAAAVPPGCGGTLLLPFASSEPCLNIASPRLEWHAAEPKEAGVRFRAALESLAFLVAMGVREHEEAGQRVERITVSGGVARSDLMCEILASVLDRPLARLRSEEGPALGAAVTALAALENRLRRERGIAEPYPIGAAVSQLVQFREPVQPRAEWREPYRRALGEFVKRLRGGV